MVVGGFRSFLLLVTTAVKGNCCLLNLTSAFTSEVSLATKTAPLGATTFSKVNLVK